MKRFKILSLGCKVNQYESAYIRNALLANGWEEAVENEPTDPTVDLVVVNTCSVTAESDAKSRKTISGASRCWPNARIIPAGCFATLSPQTAGAFPNVLAVLTDKGTIPEFLKEKLDLQKIPTGISDFGERHRAYIKIQDGCRVRCAYCIIPTVRPVLRSRAEKDIIDEIKRLDERGYREIVLTGIHLGHYGFDIGIGPCDPSMELTDYLERRANIPSENRRSLTRLLRNILENDFSARLRLGSLEAVEVSDELIEVIQKSNGRICPHFHLSMQSGDDDVLREMHRRTNSAEYAAICRSILDRMPEAALTTDVIVGFPGETEEMFQNTANAVRSIGFSKVHLFRYSPRPGTLAAGRKDQIPETVKKERLARLHETAQTARLAFAARQLGKTVSVLVEDVLTSGLFLGTDETYMTVRFTSCDQSVRPGDLLNVEINDLQSDLLIGIQR